MLPKVKLNNNNIFFDCYGKRKAEDKMFSDEYKRTKENYSKKLEKTSETGMKFTTVSGEPVEPLYNPDDLNG